MFETQDTNDTYLFLIRHGSTPNNERRPYVLQGRQSDHSLSELGREQARQVSQLLSEFRIDYVYSSPMRRAVETAEVIAEPHQLNVSIVDELIEVDVGQWEEMAWESVMSTHPQEYKAFIQDPADNGYLEGESYRDVLHRVTPALDRLLELHVGKRLVVVAHNVVNRVYLAELLRLDLAQAKDLQQNNCGVNVIRRSKTETKLITLNSTFHLIEVVT